MGRTGLEPNGLNNCIDSELCQSSKSGGAESGAVSANSILPAPLLDSDLQLVVASWADLTEGMKAGILVIGNWRVDELGGNDENV